MRGKKSRKRKKGRKREKGEEEVNSKRRSPGHDVSNLVLETVDSSCPNETYFMPKRDLLHAQKSPYFMPKRTYFVPTSTVHLLSSYLSVCTEESGRSIYRRHIYVVQYIYLIRYHLVINTSSLYTPPPPPPYMCVKSQAGRLAARHPLVEINLGESHLVRTQLDTC